MSKKLLFNNVGETNSLDDYTIIEISSSSSTTTINAKEVSELYINDISYVPSDKITIPYREKTIIKYKGNINNITNIKHFTIKQISTTTTNFYQLFSVTKYFSKDIDISNLYGKNITTMEGMFRECAFSLDSGIGNVNLSHLKFPKCKNLSEAFYSFTGRYGSYSFNNLTIDSCLFSKGVSLDYLFYGCKATNISFTNMKIQTDGTYGLFIGAGGINGRLDLSGTTIIPATSEGFNFNNICRSCNFPIIDLSCFKGRGKYFYSSFAYCTNARKIDIRNIIVSENTKYNDQVFYKVPATCEIIVEKNFPFTEQQMGFTGTFTRV